MTELIRCDADNLYADLIAKHGNPHYFIFKVIANWDNDDLENAINEMAEQIKLDDRYTVVDEE